MRAYFSAGGVNAMRSFQDMAAYCKATWAGAVYGTANEAGDILNNADLLTAAEDFGARL